MALLALIVIAARGTNLAATLLAFGSSVAALAIAPADEGRRRLAPLLRLGVAGAWLAGIVWLVVEAADMADAGTAAEALGALPTVLFGTRFGHALALRLALLLAASLVAGGRRWRWGVAAVLAGGAAGLQAWIGHAGASEEVVLPASVVVHVLAAGAWLGGLPPLWLLVSRAPMPQAVAAARRFSVLGITAVVALAGSAFVQGSELIGSIPALFGTAYGNLALAKLTLFLLLVVFATLNRLVLLPRMAGGQEKARRRLRTSIVIEAALGLAVVLTAATMAQQFPASHEQPEWPFPWRVDPGVLADPTLRHPLVLAGVCLGGAVVLGGAALLVRRVRWWLMAGAAALVAAGVLRLGVLFVPAYPTTYYTSLTDFSASSIAQGAGLFAGHCTACHGPTGRGDGPLAASLPIPPADLTAPHLWAHPDGDLFWWITNGYENPNGQGLVMPGFAGVMSDDQRWNVIDYLHAHAAGAQVAATGQWPVAVPAPEIDANCVRGELGLTDLRGGVVRILFVDATESGQVASAVTTVVLTHRPRAPGGDVCVANDPDAWAAYAIIAGVAPQALPGAQFLIDPQGWVRRLWIAGDGAPEPTQAELVAAAREVAQNPVRQNMPAHHH